MDEQVEQIDRISRLKRFLPPQVVEMVTTSGDQSFLESHRREITVVFCDLRGFTPFAETVEPEELSAVLADYYRALGDIVHRFEGTLERFAGDGMMIFFNDPLPCDDAPQRAVRMAVAMRNRVSELIERWAEHGHDLGFGVGIAQGYATIGAIGFEGRRDYAAIGTVTNLAARLCAEAAPGQILVSQRICSAAQEILVADSVGELDASRLYETRPGAQRARAERRPHQPVSAVGEVLSELSEEQRDQRFALLQGRLPAVWKAMRLNLPGEAVVVVPSVVPDATIRRSDDAGA